MLESLLGVLIGPVPALALLFFSLKGYERLFEERTLFKMFVLGLFLGLVSVIFELFRFFSLNPKEAHITFCVISIPGLAIFQTLLKLFVLGRQKFKAVPSTTFYGLALGLGFGAMYNFSLSFAALTPALKSANYYLAALTVIITIGQPFLQGATSTILGLGVATSKLLLMLGWTILIHSIFNSAAFVTNLNIISLECYTVFAVCYAISIFIYALKFLLPYSSEELRKKRRRALRKLI
ncbi:MAG: hypothetical protein QME47_06295 [Candidatus Thermoplasmatota archaeon]|nr:hypothetical protein [Candidatus Thermoplasmatota archaeon]